MSASHVTGVSQVIMVHHTNIVYYLGLQQLEMEYLHCYVGASVGSGIGVGAEAALVLAQTQAAAASAQMQAVLTWAPTQAETRRHGHM